MENESFVQQIEDNLAKLAYIIHNLKIKFDDPNDLVGKFDLIIKN